MTDTFVKLPIVTGGAATTFHSLLAELDYASSGHLGFEPTVLKGDLTEDTSSVLTITGGTGATIGAGGVTIEVAQASAGQDGYLSAADWSTFDAKEPAVTKGDLTEATSAILTITGGTGSVIGAGVSIEVQQADATHDGYLTAADYIAFSTAAAGDHSTLVNRDVAGNHAKLVPTADAVTAIQITKADGTTPIVNVDTTNSFVGIGTIAPIDKLHVYGTDNSLLHPDDIQLNSINIDGPSDCDKNLHFCDAGSPVWEIQTYRDENAKFLYTYNIQSDANVVAISTQGRMGINKQYGTSEVPTYTGSGLNDMIAGGDYSRSAQAVYKVIIGSIGATDKYQWAVSYDNGVTYGSNSSAEDIVLTPITIDDGVTITFGATTGHAADDQWIFYAYPQLPNGTVTIAPNKTHIILMTTDYTSPTFTDQTYNLNTTAGVDLAFPLGTTGALYFGVYSPISNLFYNASAIAGTGLTLVVEYYNGSSWVALNLATNYYIDNTTNLTKSGNILFEESTMTGWSEAVPHVGLDTLYWLRLRTSTNVTVSPTMSNFSIHGENRLACFTGFYDPLPTFSVDSAGKTTIGTIKTTGSHILTVTQPSGASKAETIARFQVSDNAKNWLDIRNSSATDGTFTPALWGYTSATTSGINLIGSCLAASDSGTTGTVLIHGRRWNEATQTASALVTRPILQIINSTVGLSSWTPTVFHVGTTASLPTANTNNRIGMDVQCNSILIGSEGGSKARATNATKYGNIVTTAYTNTNRAATVFCTINNNTLNAITFGGGNSDYNAATSVSFYVAENNNTAAGTLTFRISPSQLEVMDAVNFVFDTTTGTKIGTATTQKLAFYNSTPIVQPAANTAASTTLTASAPGTPDYAIADGTQTTPYGFTTADEFQTVMQTIINLQTRVAELETKLKDLGLIAT